MRKMILIFVIQLLYHITRVESLIGENLTQIGGGEFPFIASFQYFPEDENFCGGALITKKHVLTLAHCLNDVSPERFRIVFELANAQGPVLTYTAASWTTSNNWAERQGIPEDLYDFVYDVAIVKLTDRVYHVNPVPLNGFTKSQLVGKTAKMIGWSTVDVLSKATVKLLSNEDCERSIRVLSNNIPLFDDRVLCSAANPSALLHTGDMGSPLLHAGDNSLLGIAYGFYPVEEFEDSNFSTDFIRQHQVNMHMNVHNYQFRLFIHSIIPAAPAA